MEIRFGYVAIALRLKDSSTSKTITLKNLEKIMGVKPKLTKLRRITAENLDNTLRIIRYNNEEQIHVYRLTSKLIPFSTYPLEFEWDYIDIFKPEFKKIGELIKLSAIRISAHPDHFTVINSPTEKVFSDSVNDLEYHDHIFNAMGLNEQSKLITHLGGFYGDRDQSIARFKKNFSRLPQGIRSRIVLENDDKIYTAEEILKICEELKIPMVLDLHHHSCNPGGDLEDLIPKIWDTWTDISPKIHVSSPKEQKSFRHHADYVDASSVKSFLNLAKKVNRDFDIMVEAKMKDSAMFKLVKDLSEYDDITQVDQSTLRL